MVVLVVSVVRVRFRQDGFDFENTDHRQPADKEQEKGEEDAESADERPDIDPRRIEHVPARRQKVTVQRSHDDDEALEPHAGVDEHADHEDPEHVAAEEAEPE